MNDDACREWCTAGPSTVLGAKVLREAAAEIARCSRERRAARARATRKP